jgi:hypothetical protein
LSLGHLTTYFLMFFTLSWRNGQSLIFLKHGLTMPLFLFVGLGSSRDLQLLFWNHCQVNNTITSLTKWQSINVCFIWAMACFNNNTLLLPYDFLCSLFIIECETLSNKNISTKVTPLTLFLNSLPFSLWSCFMMFLICDHKLRFFLG